MPRRDRTASLIGDYDAIAISVDSFRIITADLRFIKRRGAPCRARARLRARSLRCFTAACR